MCGTAVKGNPDHEFSHEGKRAANIEDAGLSSVRHCPVLSVQDSTLSKRPISMTQEHAISQSSNRGCHTSIH